MNQDNLAIKVMEALMIDAPELDEKQCAILCTQFIERVKTYWFMLPKMEHHSDPVLMDEMDEELRIIEETRKREAAVIVSPLEFSGNLKRIKREQEFFAPLIAVTDRELVSIDEVDETLPVEAAYTASHSYERLNNMGWELLGFKIVGGWGSSVYHEFIHPKYGSLHFNAEISHQLEGTDEWKDAQDKAWREDFDTPWIMMLNGNGLGPVFLGNNLDDLETQQKQIDIDRPQY
jgi:hypothetical protein